MPVLSPSYKRYLTRRQEEVDSEKNELTSKLDLYNEKSFYGAFVKDLLTAQKEVIIHCPFISKYRSEFFKDTFIKLRQRNIPIFVFTRPLDEHEYFAKSEISCALREYQENGATIIYQSGFIHQKVAVIDRKVLWEGSLNILSQRTSKELMRRIDDEDTSLQMIDYLDLGKRLIDEYKLLYEKMCQNLISSDRDRKRKRVLFILAGAVAPITIFAIIAAIRYLVILLNSSWIMTLISSLSK